MNAELAIVGGGPTGLGASIIAALAGFHPVVFEPKEGIIDKACGEGLMPAGLDHLLRMGVNPKGREFVGIRYLDGISGRGPEGRFGSPGRGVRRLELHRALLERAQELGVKFVHAKVQDLEQSANQVTLVTTAGSWNAKHVIAADGLHSRIRRKLGIESKTPKFKRYGVRRHYQLEPWSDFVEVYWIDGAEAYVTPVSDSCVGIAMLFEPRSDFDELLAQFPALQDKILDAPFASQDQGAGPFEQRLPRHSQGRVLLCGDAAGYLDPLTGEGIAMGLASAQAAVECIVADDVLGYDDAYKRVTAPYYRNATNLLAFTRSRTMQRVMLSALRLPHLFDGILGQVAK